MNAATKKAVIEALRLVEDGDAQWEHPSITARPVVVGGDDVTLILPADRAVAITERFLRAFTDHTATMLQRLRDDYPELSTLKNRSHFTACAGVVFQKQKYPLLQGYEHSEGLCSFAKKEGANTDGTTTPGLLFTRLLDSDRSDQELRRSRDFIEPESGVRTCGGPYAIDEDKGLVTLEALRELAAGLGDDRLATNSAREIIDHLHRDVTAAKEAFDRAQYVGGENAKDFAEELEGAAALRTQDTKGFQPLSLLPDAAILAKMESL